MSERGSFVTEYIYCERCFEAAKKILLEREKYLCSIALPSWEEGGVGLPIIAGKIGGLYQNEEFDTFKKELLPKLHLELCHTIRIAVLAEKDEKIFRVSGIKKYSDDETAGMVK